jgi:hypothetical protein
METSLHRTLKERYAVGGSGHLEVMVAGFRIDAVDDAGRLIEIQSAPLGALRRKLGRLLPDHRMRIVKPVALGRRIIRRARRDGPDLKARRSPKCGSALDVFDDFVGIVRLFPHVNLEIEVLQVNVDEVRVPRHRWPGYFVADRVLGAILGTISLVRADDLWSLLPDGSNWREPFTTRELAQAIARPIWFAQRVAYCLRHSGAARVVGKSGNRLIYVRKP